MNEIFSYKDLNLAAEFKDVDGKKGIVTGYFSNFDNVDSDGDIIRKGAFLKTISEQGPKSSQPRIKHLYNHNPSQPLGVITELKEDNKGLYYESKIGIHSLGVEFIKMVESGLITDHSIGYKVINSTKIKTGREIKEIKLWEGSSLSAWGANGSTPLLSLKGIANIDAVIAQQKAVEKFCKTSDVSDETIEMLLLHSKQLSQYIIDLKSFTEPGNTTQPEVWKGWFN